ncbi:hypothetical protein AAVH_16769 [Aphelenchoides avenae]|nr:hypothetical protein AAVH_16769 [Aphelenchus avenae]
MLMIALLKQSDGSRNLYDYKALVFYPANDGTEYCIRNGTGGDLYSSMHNNVRFLLARYDQAQLFNITERVMGSTVDAALRKFRAVIAIKCARKFVWYELGYRYFQAAWTNAVAIPTSYPSANDYSYKCGNTVVFP